MAKEDAAVQAAEVNAAKLKALQATIDKIEKDYGKGTIMKLGDQPQWDVQVIPSGSVALDHALGIGGYPRGRIIEIYGPESSGKTTLAIHAIAEAQKLGGIAANTVELWKFGDSFTDDDVKAGISEKMKNVYGNGHTSLYADVIGAIEEKREPYVTLEAGRRALELVLAIYKSQKTGEVVKLPLGDFSSADMAGEFGQ